MSLLLQSSTAPEDRPHQFHLLHLCQWRMDRHIHVVHRTSSEIAYSPCPQAERFSQQKTDTTLKSNMDPYVWPFPSAPSPSLQG